MDFAVSLVALITDPLGDIAAHGDPSRYGPYFPAYLLKCRQYWFQHHGDELDAELKHIRNALDQILASPSLPLRSRGTPTTSHCSRPLIGCSTPSAANASRPTTASCRCFDLRRDQRGVTPRRFSITSRSTRSTRKQLYSRAAFITKKRS
ncbi:MAG: hypothetical protein HS122_13985 [Opitutaceae bacterium]|nr:hypothetical protein [Opitutaceae bacterium]